MSTVVLAAAGCVLAHYVLFTPLSAHALINAESAVALAFLLALFTRSMPLEGPVTDSRHPYSLRDVWLFLILLVIIAAAYARILNAPFVFDDYGHITDAAQSNWRATMGLFGPANNKAGVFFRPFGFTLYRLNYLWATDHAGQWHAGSMALHAIDSWLVYVLCRDLGLARTGSGCAALLFAMNACAVEPVAWIDAGFDLLATGFCLAALILTCRYLDCGRRRWLIAAMAAAFAAMLTKESAFCLPALVACTVLVRAGSSGQRDLPALLWVTAESSVIFAYRWWAIGGLGGYGLPFTMVHTLNGLFLRLWAILLFPINWSTPASLFLKAAVVTVAAFLVLIVSLGRITRARLLGCLAFTFAAAVPVYSMLLIGADLTGSRVLYLPAVGMAILLGILLGSLGPRLRTVVMCGLFAIQVTMLEHNLAPWREVPELARSTCVSFGRQLSLRPGRVIVRGLPARKSGVVFLANAFPQCVQMNSGVGADRIEVQTRPGIDSGPAMFTWDDGHGLVPSR